MRRVARWAALGSLLAACFDWSTAPHDGAANDGGALDGGGSEAASDAPTDETSDGDAASADCPTCAVVADGLAGPLSSLSATPDGTRLYWVAPVGATDGVWRHVVDAGAAEFSAKPAKLVTASNDAVFFSDDASVHRVALDGGALTLSPQLLAVGALAWADADLFALLWADAKTMKQCVKPDKPGCDADAGGLLSYDTVVSGVTSTPVALAGLRDFAALVTADARLLRTSGTSDLVELDRVAGEKGAAAVARGAFIDASDEIVWAASTSTLGTIRRVFRQKAEASFDAGAPVVALAFDGADVVFVTRDADATFTLARIDHTLSVEAGAPRTVATKQRGVTRVAVAAGGVYFTRQAGAAWQLVRLPQ